MLFFNVSSHFFCLYLMVQTKNVFVIVPMLTKTTLKRFISNLCTVSVGGALCKVQRHIPLLALSWTALCPLLYFTIVFLLSIPLCGC